MKTQIIRLESHDDFISIRDKISWSKARRILLVLPRRRPPQLQQLDFILLQRQARSLGAQIGIVTQDREIAREAENLGISIFPTVPSAQRMIWKPVGRKRRLVRFNKRHPVRKETLQKWLAETHPPPEKNWVRFSFFSIGLLAFLSLMMFFFPTATIRIKPHQEEQRLQMTLLASPRFTVLSPSGLLPAERVVAVVEGSISENATGVTLIGEKKASGRVRLINLTSEEVPVPLGTIIRTIEQPYIRFETTRNVTLPAGSGQSREVTVRAVEAGSAGNIPAERLGVIEGNLGLKVAAENPDEIFGGSDRQGRVVSETDAARVYDTLIVSLSEDALQQMGRNLSNGKTLLPETLVISSIREKVYQPQIGELADRFTLTLEVEFQAWACEDADLKRVLMDAMNASLPEGMMPLDETFEIKERIPLRFDKDEVAEFQVEASRILKEMVEPAQVTNAVRGLPVEAASAIISQQYRLADSPEIDLTPQWWNRLPFLTFRIVVEEE